MPSRGPVDWSVADVQEWLVNELQLPPAVAAAFKDNAIAGPDLLTLSDEDLTAELSCKPLQARKIRQALVKMGFHPPGSEGAAAAAAAAAAPAPAPATEHKPAAAATAAPAAAPAPVAAAAVAPPPAGYPPPAVAAAPAPYPPPPGGAPMPYGAPPAPVPYGAAPPAYAYPPPEPAPPQKDNTGKAVAAAVLLTAPRRNFRRGVAMGRMM